MDEQIKKLGNYATSLILSFHTMTYHVLGLVLYVLGKKGLRHYNCVRGSKIKVPPDVP